MVGRAGHELVLAGRRGRALADAAAGEDRARRQRGGGHRLPRGLLDLDRGRLGAGRLARGRPHHAVADAGRRGAARRVRDRSRLVHLRRAAAPRASGYLGDLLPRAAASALRIDLAGLAIAGGLFIVPAFAAVQSWAGADRRARVVAAVNVLNAAFMAAARCRRRCCRRPGVTTPQLFLLLGVANLVVAVAIGRTMPASGAAAIASPSSIARCSASR